MNEHDSTNNYMRKISFAPWSTFCPKTSTDRLRAEQTGRGNGASIRFRQGVVFGGRAEGVVAEFLEELARTEHARVLDHVEGGLLLARAVGRTAGRGSVESLDAVTSASPGANYWSLLATV